MQKLMLLAAFFLLSSIAYSQALQTREVPSNVTDKIKALYPNAEKVSWEMEDGFYEASFRNNKQETSVTLSSQAVLVRTEVELDKSVWPSFISSFLSTRSDSPKAEEVDMVTDIHGTVTYEVEAGDMEYILDAKGTLLTEKKEMEEDDDDNDDQ